MGRLPQMEGPMSAIVEDLERRRLFAAFAPLGITGKGTLYVNGTSGRDFISIITNSRRSAVVTINAQVGFELSGFKRIFVQGAGGADTIMFSGKTDVPGSLLGGNCNDT